MTAPPDDRDFPHADTPMARVLGPALRAHDLSSALEPLRRLAAEDVEDATARRVLEAVELLADSLQIHAASAPGTKINNTVPTMGLDRALFQLGMGNLEMAEAVLHELSEGEPDNDIVERHLDAVQTIAAAASGELTRTHISVADPDHGGVGEDAWDDGTEVQGRQEDPFEALDESLVRPPVASQEVTAPDITGRTAVPEVTGRAVPEYRAKRGSSTENVRSTMDASPRARRARKLADEASGAGAAGAPAPVPETRESALPADRTDHRTRCEDRGSVAVRPVVTVGGLG